MHSSLFFKLHVSMFHARSQYFVSNALTRKTKIAGAAAAAAAAGAGTCGVG